MVAHRRADRCRHWNPHGVHHLRLHLAKPRSRHVVLATFSLIIIYASILGALNLIHHAIMWRPIINASIFGGASVWYFYFQTRRRRIFSRTEETRSTNHAQPTYLMSNSLTNRGNATAAGSRIRYVANRDKDVSSGFTSTSSPLLAMARNAQSMMYPNVAVVPMTSAKSQAPSSRKFSTR